MKKFVALLFLGILVVLIFKGQNHKTKVILIYDDVKKQSLNTAKSYYVSQRNQGMFMSLAKEDLDSYHNVYPAYEMTEKERRRRRSIIKKLLNADHLMDQSFRKKIK